MGKEALGQALLPLLGPWGKQCVALAEAKKQLGRSHWRCDHGASGKARLVVWEGLGHGEMPGAVHSQNWEHLHGWEQLL